MLWLVRAKLRLVALAVASVGVVFWFFGGPHFGWTKTTVEIWKVDPVTEIKFPEFEKRFVPGMDFLGGVLIVSGLLWGTSLLARHRGEQ
jgi:hypothetical protein